MQEFIIKHIDQWFGKIFRIFVLILVIILNVCLPAFGGQQFTQVQDELEKLGNLPVASKEEFEKFTSDERARSLRALGLFEASTVKNLRDKAATANRYGEWREVIDSYEKILTIDPQDWGAFLMLANSYNGVGNPDKSLEYAAKALDKVRYNVLFAIVADAYGKKGDKYKAFSWLEKALKGGFTMSKENFDKTFEQYQYDSQYNELLKKYNIK